MKTRYKYIHFEEIPQGRGPNVWYCCNNVGIKTDSGLGRVEYYKPWKRFIFGRTDYYAIFSHDCLLDIADFLKQLNEAKK